MRNLLAATLTGLIAVPAVRADDPEPYAMTWDTLLVAAAKVDKGFEYDRHGADLLQHFSPRTWQAVRNNEFKLPAATRQAVAEFKEKVAAFSLERDIVLQANLRIGAYDFDRKSFAVENMGETSYWYSNHQGGGLNHLPYRYCVYFSNRTLLAAVPLEPAAAELLLEKRKDRYGNVNRELPATIRFRVLKGRDDPGSLTAEIQSAVIYADKNRTDVVWETRKPAPAKAADGRKP